MSNSNKNVGQQLSDAINDAINSSDYSQLKFTVEQTLSEAGRAVQFGLSHAASSAKSAYASHSEFAAQQQAMQEARKAEAERIAREQQEAAARNRALEARNTALFGKTTGKKVGAWCATFFGAMFILAGVQNIAEELSWFVKYGWSIYWDEVINYIITAAIGGALAWWGTRRIGLLRRFDAFKHIIGLRGSVSVSELCAQTGRAAADVLADLRKLIQMKLFRQGHINDVGTYFMITNAEYEQYRRGLEAARAYEREQQAEQEAAAKAAQAPEAPGKQQAPAGAGAAFATTQDLPENVRAILERGQAFVAQIRASNDAIPGEEVSRKIDQIELVLQTIFTRAAEHPEVVDDLDRLMNYYLPTTVKLLDAYRDLDSQPIQGENIVKSKRDIEETLDALNVAFEKLLNQIFDDVAWDISSDVSVLQTVLAQEGLTENPFKDSAK